MAGATPRRERFSQSAVLPKATQLGFTVPPALRKSASKPAATRFEVTSLALAP